MTVSGLTQLRIYQNLKGLLIFYVVGEYMAFRSLPDYNKHLIHGSFYVIMLSEPATVVS